MPRLNIIVSIFHFKQAILVLLKCQDSVLLNMLAHLHRNFCGLLKCIQINTVSH